MNNYSSLIDLILISIDEVIKTKKKCSFGDVVYEVFTKYPKHFCIPDYPNWPDTLKLDRKLRNLRSDRLITGSPGTFYTLTRLGKEKLRELKEVTNPSLETIDNLTRNPSLGLLKEVEKSSDFKAYLSQMETFKPSNMTIRAIIRFTLETPKKVVINQLQFLKKTAHKENRTDLENFLSLYINFIQETN